MGRCKSIRERSSMRSILLASTILAVAATAHAATPDQVLAANRAATGALGAGEMRLTYDYAGQGLTGVATAAYDTRTGAFVETSDVGPLHEGDGFDGREAWMREDSGGIVPEAGGDKRQIAVNQAYRNAQLWWRPDHGGALVTSGGARTRDGKTYDVLSVTPKGGKAFEAWFGQDDHLLARVVEPQAFMTFTTDFSDYRPAGGGKTPGKVVIDTGQGPDDLQTQVLKTATVGPARPASAYAMPKFVVTDATIANSSGRTTVPFQLLNNHIYADVKVNGKGPYLFIFDTGGHTLLTPQSAKAMGISVIGQGSAGGAGDNVVQSGFAEHMTFQIGDLTLKDQPGFVVPYQSTQVDGFEQSGMMGFPLFRRFVTTVDYEKKTLTFTDPAQFDPKGAGVPVPFVFYDHLPQVAGTFEGAPGMFDIDTGSRVEVTITKPNADRLKLQETHKGVKAVDGWGVGGRTFSYITRGQAMTLGPVKVGGVVAGLGLQSKGSLSDPNYLGNVGTKLLKRWIVTFDYDHRIMYLKPRSAPADDADTFDRAGLWMNAAANGLEVVDVTAGGAAQAAGLKVGDRITAVDGAPAKGGQLSDLRARLRDPKTAKVALTVESGGQSRVVDLTLKDLI